MTERYSGVLKHEEKNGRRMQEEEGFGERKGSTKLL
jgi:hypothetical protein